MLDAGVVTNRNTVPGDSNGAWYTSGIRLGTPALTETNPAGVHEAIERATHAIGASRWTPVGATLPSITGAGGAIEAFIHARRR